MPAFEVRGGPSAVPLAEPIAQKRCLSVTCPEEATVPLLQTMVAIQKDGHLAALLIVPTAPKKQLIAMPPLLGIAFAPMHLTITVTSTDGRPVVATKMKNVPAILLQAVSSCMKHQTLHTWEVRW